MTTSPLPHCPHCGNLPHKGQCPRIASIDYYEDGTVKRVEYWPFDEQPLKVTSLGDFSCLT